MLINTKYIIFTLIIIVYTLLSSCTLVNRTERDIHTITELDSISYQAANDKFNIINSIYPPSNKIIKTTKIIQYDSIVLRHYPQYIRAGIFENFGYFSNFSGNNNMGIFGIPSLNLDDTKNNNIFSMGGIRIGFLEYKLQWDDDIENFTFGTCMYESFYSGDKQTVSSLMPLYFTKRFFLNNAVPNLTLATSLGFSYYPNTYINITETLEYGSYAGLNIKFKVGLLNVLDDNITIYPYVGVGFSIFDFFNKEEEIQTQWKDVKHRAWNMGLINIGIHNEGMEFELLLNKIALPYLNNNLIIGTSLANISIYNDAISTSILPIYTSYRKNIYKNKVIFEPYVRFNYYPTLFIETGGEFSLRINELFSLKFGLEYSKGNGYYYDIKKLHIGEDIPFSKFIFYIKFGLGDRIFFPNEMY